RWLGSGQSETADYVKIQTGPLRMTVQTTGPLKPIKTVPVGSEVSGTMDWIGADYNDRVKAGQVIAKLRPELFQAEVKAATAARENAEAAHQKAILVREDLKKRLPLLTALASATVERAQAAFGLADYNWKRVQEMSGSGVSSEVEQHLNKQSYEDAKAALAMA